MTVEESPGSGRGERKNVRQVIQTGYDSRYTSIRLWQLLLPFSKWSDDAPAQQKTAQLTILGGIDAPTPLEHTPQFARIVTLGRLVCKLLQHLKVHQRYPWFGIGTHGARVDGSPIRPASVKVAGKGRFVLNAVVSSRGVLAREHGALAAERAGSG